MTTMRAVLVLAIAVVAGPACYRAARTGPDVHGYAVEPAKEDPVEIRRAPRVYWRGDFAYFLDGRWYVRAKDGWVVFVEEPPDLARERDSVGTETPPVELAPPRGPTVYRPPAEGGPLAFPPPSAD